MKSHTSVSSPLRFGTLVLSMMLLATSARAQSSEAPSPGGQGWSVLSGKTVGSGQNAIFGQVGWPGISATLLHGLTPKVDVGGRLTFNYGYEGNVTAVLPGLKLQGVFRATLLESGRVNLGLNLSPGVFFYFGGATVSGLAIPLGLVLGIPASSAVTLNVGLDVPMYVRLNPWTELAVPILAGAGAEYFIDQSLAVTFNTRMGPTLIAYRSATFTFEALLGVALKL